MFLKLASDHHPWLSVRTSETHFPVAVDLDLAAVLFELLKKGKSNRVSLE